LESEVELELAVGGVGTGGRGQLRPAVEEGRRQRGTPEEGTQRCLWWWSRPDPRLLLLPLLLLRRRRQACQCGRPRTPRTNRGGSRESEREGREEDDEEEEDEDEHEEGDCVRNVKIVCCVCLYSV
jgi:hypothetical protein